MNNEKRHVTDPLNPITEHICIFQLVLFVYHPQLHSLVLVLSSNFPSTKKFLVRKKKEIYKQKFISMTFSGPDSTQTMVVAD